ncbi:ATP-binding protein [Oceanicoccus sp. KOV_DT_Chl]|uniref:ATP-binding protein n=1 Tax=Oceanicoccus sp. KOV_DT_Chl TaxID=1904639 RepID=UPI000C7D861B|nr:ATP-binding protein [Oceanicoccus sp. KOV_DT_Chl]
MRLLQLLLCVLLLVIAITYNYTHRQNNLTAVQTISSLNEVLGNRGRLRNSMVNAYASHLERERQGIKAPFIFTIQANHLPLSYGLSDPQHELWPQAKEILRQNARLQSILKTLEIKIQQQHSDQASVDIKKTIDEAIEVIDHLQQLDIEKTQLLVNFLLQQQTRGLLINAGLIVPALLLLFWFSFTRQKNALNHSNELNKALNNKQSELVKAQKIMTSILEDTRIEKELAVKLAKQNELLAKMVAEASDAMLQLAPDGKVLIKNHAAEKLFNLKNNNNPDLNIKSFFTPDQAIDIQDTLTSTIKHHQAISTTINGDTLGRLTREKYLLNFSPMSGEKANSNSISLIIHNTTAQYEEQENLTLLINQAPIALIVADEDGNITFANAQADQLFGYQPEQLQQLKIEALVPDNVKSQHPKNRLNFRKNPAARAMGEGRDLKGLRKNGTEIPIEIGLSPLTTATGNYVVASIIDITERRNAQSKLETLNEQLATKNKEQKAFCYSLSHDFKASIRRIDQWTQLLEDDLKHRASLNEKDAETFDAIATNIDQINNLVENLYQLLYAEADDQLPQPVDLNRILQRIEQVMRSYPEREFDIQAAPLPTITGNEAQLLILFQNILSNAIKHNDNVVPTITITAELDRNTSTQRIIFSDNGPGIEDEWIERIFEPFFRAEKSHYNGGTGLGLSICTRVMDWHGGSIKVKSQIGNGSQFILNFPA